MGMEKSTTKYADVAAVSASLKRASAEDSVLDVPQSVVATSGRLIPNSSGMLDTVLAENLRNQALVESQLSSLVVPRLLLQQELNRRNLLHFGTGMTPSTLASFGLGTRWHGGIDRLLEANSSSRSFLSSDLAPTRKTSDPEAELSFRPVQGRCGTFPQKVHKMLSELEKTENGKKIACWLPDGRAFFIHKQDDFVKDVMPKYFRMQQFSSFQRQLNLYGFQRIPKGPLKGSYYHRLFIRGEPQFCFRIRRNKINA